MESCYLQLKKKGLPIESIKECLNQTNIDCAEITDIAINTNPLSNIKEKTIFF